MSWVLYIIAVAMVVTGMAGNWFSGKKNLLLQSLVFDFIGGVGVGLAYLAGKVAV